jgi:hypothetical protein
MLACQKAHVLPMYIFQSSSLGPSFFPQYVGCYNGSGIRRDLPVFFCSNGTTPASGDGSPGCAHDSRIPNNHTYASTWAGGLTMTPSLCAAQCTGFKFFGVQDGFSCFCGDTYGNKGKVPESECSSQCLGDSSAICGGFALNSICAQPHPTRPPPPSPPVGTEGIMALST